VSTKIDLLPGRWALLLGHAATPRRRAVAGLLLALSLLLFLLAAAAMLQAQRRLQDARQAQRVVSRPAPPDLVAGLPAAAERLRINRAVRQLNTPWPMLFAALEAEASDTVAVLSVEPNAERGAVRVQTEGPALEALLTHAERLGRRAPFGQVQLLRVEEKEELGRPFARLSFELLLLR
jgi:hypothetical protein